MRMPNRLQNPSPWPRAYGILLWLLGLLPGLCAGLPGAASAAAPMDAAALRQEGQQALTAGDLATAQERIAASFKLEPAPETLCWLGQIAQAQGESMRAADLYRRYLDAAAAAQPGCDRDPLLRHIAEQTERGSEITVLGSSGALVFLDTRLVGSLPLNLPLLMSPGAHTIELQGATAAAPVPFTVKAKRHLVITFGKSFPVIKEVPAALLLPLPAGLAPPLSAAVRQAVQKGLAEEDKAALISPDAAGAALRRTRALASCLDEEECLAALVAAVNARYAIRVHLELSPGADPGGGSAAYRLAVQLFDGPSGEWTPTAAGSCDSCSLAQAMEKLRDQTSQLMQQALNQARGKLVLTTQPPGASVMVNGRRRGTTPFEREAAVGTYQVSLAKSGYATTTDSVGIEDGVTARLHRVLPRLPDSSGAGKRRTVRAAAWTLLGLGTASLALGGTLWGLDGYQACDVAATRRCALELDSQTAGITLVAGGGAALLTSIVLLGVDARRAQGGRESPRSTGLLARQ